MILQLAAAVGLRMLLAGSSPAEPRVYFEPAPGPLAPGQVLEVRWEGLPADVGECELLLDLDGDRARLRITDELDPRTNSYRWSVPNLSAREARLVLRMNRIGREVEIAPSAPFRIGMTEGAPRVTLDLRSGEIWLSESGDGDDLMPEPPASRMSGSSPAVSASMVVELAASLPRSEGGLAPAAPPRERARILCVRPERRPARPVFGLSSLLVPQRI